MKKSILLLICLISFVVSISATNLSGYKLIRTQEYNTNDVSQIKKDFKDLKSYSFEYSNKKDSFTVHQDSVKFSITPNNEFTINFSKSSTTNNKSSTYNAYYILSVTEDKKVIVSYYIPEDIQ